MFKYEKMLEYPINIKRKDLKMAKLLSDQLGGANGELGASLRYLCQRFTMPDEKGRALLSDIGCEEIGHCEMIATMIHQLMNGATIDEIKNAVYLIIILLIRKVFIQVVRMECHLLQLILLQVEML